MVVVLGEGDVIDERHVTFELFQHLARFQAVDPRGGEYNQCGRCITVNEGSVCSQVP